jgi:hypothetical protein
MYVSTTPLTPSVSDTPNIHFHTQLIYNDSVDPDYEPPGFVAANADALGSFSRQPLRLPFGGVRSDHHKCALSVRSVLDASAPQSDGEEVVASQANHSAALAQCPIHGLGPASQSNARTVPRPHAGSGGGRRAGLAEGCDSDATREEGADKGAIMDVDTAAMPPPPLPSLRHGAAASKAAADAPVGQMVEMTDRLAHLSVPQQQAGKKRAGAAAEAPAAGGSDDGEMEKAAAGGWKKRLRGDAKVSTPAETHIVQRKPTGADDVFSAAFL